jgi:chloramphenicol-sensitive protein RarD
LKNYRTGLIFGVSAYGLWGLFPLYWPLLEPANPVEIVAHRAIWTLVFCTIVLLFKHQLKQTLLLLKNKKVFWYLVLATVLISINWLTYIWAANNGHVVESALGYYINPLIVIASGTIIYHEKLRKLQIYSIAVATIGVIVLTIDNGRLPWIALTLAFSWGFYGVVKKHLQLGSLESLTIETLIAFLPYFIYLVWLGLHSKGHFGTHPKVTVLLTLAGVVTAIPLLFFNGAATRLPLSVTGLLQYLNPTIQFMIGVLVRHEKMSSGRWIGFFIIWISLFFLAADITKSSRSIDYTLSEVD